MPKNKYRYQQFEFDKLQMYFRDPYTINEGDSDKALTIYQPSIGDIVRIGEKRFNLTLSIFITNTTAWRLPLWEQGIDWCELSDFELFVMLYKGIEKEVSSLLFKDIDFSEYQVFERHDPDKDGTEVVLYNPVTKHIIDEDAYQHFAQYLRQMFGITIEEKITKSDSLKKMYIEKDKREQHNEEIKKEKGEGTHSSVQSLISACVNHPGFKYKLSELREVGVCEFYDSVRRLQLYESCSALMKGMYSGFMDTSKIKSEQYNFMKDI